MCKKELVTHEGGYLLITQKQALGLEVALPMLTQKRAQHLRSRLLFAVQGRSKGSGMIDTLLEPCFKSSSTS